VPTVATSWRRSDGQAARPELDLAAADGVQRQQRLGEFQARPLAWSDESQKVSALARAVYLLVGGSGTGETNCDRGW
jgi:hypothetical protein